MPKVLYQNDAVDRIKAEAMLRACPEGGQYGLVRVGGNGQLVVSYRIGNLINHANIENIPEEFKQNLTLSNKALNDYLDAALSNFSISGQYGPLPRVALTEVSPDILENVRKADASPEDPVNKTETTLKTTEEVNHAFKLSIFKPKLVETFKALENGCKDESNTKDHLLEIRNKAEKVLIMYKRISDQLPVSYDKENLTQLYTKRLHQIDEMIKRMPDDKNMPTPDK